MHVIPRRLLLLFLFLLLPGCTYLPTFPYKIDIQQGNVVTEEMVARLKPGMSRSQVRFAFGTPLIMDVFHSDRWDYIYRLAPSGNLAEEQQLTVFFGNDRLTHLRGNFPQPPAFSESSVIGPVSDKAFGATAGHSSDTPPESEQGQGQG